MRHGWTVTCTAFMFLVSGGALAQQVSLDDLRGYSLMINQDEVINRRRGGTERRSWNEQIYVSSEGRVFHREDRKSDAGRDRFRENVGSAQGGGRKFSWTGDGFSRSWVNQRGRDIRQHIRVVRTQSGFGCAMDIERTGRGTIDILRSSCRVIRGNVFAGSS